MDNHSEVEAKFYAGLVSNADIQRFIANLEERRYHSLKKYKEVTGWDQYYRRGNDVIRHRCDGTRKTSVLTVKRRKSADSLSDRHEVDVPIQESVPAETVAAFLTMSGWEPYFKIHKTSYIWHISDGIADICLARYSVWTDENPTAEWFLEVEIEKDNVFVTHDEALALLRGWIIMLQESLEISPPLNESLLELYRPDKPVQSDISAGVTSTAGIDT